MRHDIRRTEGEGEESLRDPIFLEPLEVSVSMQDAHQERDEQIERDADASYADLRGRISLAIRLLSRQKEKIHRQ